MKSALALVVACLAAHSAACRADASPIRVATLNTVLTEVAREVGGAQVDVTGLVRPGVDPHTFNPSPADVRAIVDADLVLASGMNLEAYLGRLIASAGPKGRVLSVGSLVPVVLTTRSGERDPHWWHCITDMISAVDSVRLELTRLRPASADDFARNAAAYQQRLRALMAWTEREVATLPAERRQLVTSHDAFGYFAHDYGFTVHPINGLSTDGEADARHLAGLVDLIRRKRIGAIFVESSANPRLVENLLEETGARLGGTLYADGLGTAGSGAETYDSMFRHNVLTIVGALSAP